MLIPSILPLLVPWDYVHREHAALQVDTPFLPLVEACNTAPFWSVRDAHICNTALDLSRSYGPAPLIQLDIMPDICGASSATNKDYAPSRFPLRWRDTFEGWWRRANHGWHMSAHIRNAVFQGNKSWHEVSIKGDWMQVGKMLECIKGVGAVDSKAKTLNVLIEQPSICNPPYGYINYPVPTFNDVKSTTDALLGTLGHLSNIRTLRMQVPDIHTDWFDTSLSTNHTSANTTTNGITSLILGPFTHGLISHTPHLKNVFLDERLFGHSQVAQDALVAAVEHSASAVEHLELMKINEGTLAGAARAIPGLKTLELQAAVMDLWKYNLKLKDLIPGLSLFTNVTSLSLPSVKLLDANYNLRCSDNAEDPEFWEVLEALHTSQIRDWDYKVERPGNRQNDTKLAGLLETVKTGLPLVERVRFGGGDWYGIR